jgi:thiol:disulfide interchange protein DsbD
MKITHITLIIIFNLFAFCAKAGALQDTVSTRGLEFTQMQPGAEPAKAAIAKSAKRPLAPAGQDVKPHSKRPRQQKEHTSLWSIFAAGFLGGLAALFMPCIFPMLPLTVSYFTKKAHTRTKAVSTAIFYGLSIIVIYVALGLIITVAFGADALNSLATNGVFNLLFFALLVLFAASFLGAFEITLPNSWVNKMDERSEKSGFAGIFFMAATLSLVSFSCTGPIIGTLLVQAAVSGALLGPATGMFGFALALAIPFTLFATFPSLLQSLPKSGGWLNSIKVVLGFLELALALKFLSNVDLAYHWHWFDREVYLVLWIVIFALMGFYLLGKLKFVNDSDVPHTSVPRLFLSIIVLSFSIYMIPGLWGAPLKSIAAFLPPMETQDFDLYTPTLEKGQNAIIKDAQFPANVKYQSLFKAPLKLNAFFDYKEGIEYARKINKPVMIDFTGHACVNCRKMEETVWIDPAVYPVIRDKFVLIELYVDDKTDLSEAERYRSGFSHREVTTIGALNSDIQASRYNSNSQPFYVLLDPESEKPLNEPGGADYSAVSYLSFLQQGLSAYPHK